MAKTLQEIRTDQGHSQIALADLSGVGSRTITRAETGRGVPHDAQRRAIAFALGLPVEAVEYPGDRMLRIAAPYKQLERASKVHIESSPYVLCDLVEKDAEFKARLDRMVAIYSVDGMADRWARERDGLQAQESVNIRRPNPRIVTVNFRYLELWLLAQPEAAAILKLEAASP